jgi:hypothetical protein
MGTNYYLSQKPNCEHCGQPSGARLHIGKSSGGWCFALHVVPARGIYTLSDWRELWNKPGAVIRDEYGRSISIEEMEQYITNRSWFRGPLQRHDVDGQHCLGHGPGTWDYIAGDFA